MQYIEVTTHSPLSDIAHFTYTHTSQRESFTQVGTELFESYGFDFQYPFTQPFYPVVSVAFYALTLYVFTPDTNTKKKTPKTAAIKSKPSGLTPTKAFVFTHNLVLCIFSWIVFINVFPEIYAKIFSGKHGTNYYANWQSFQCDPMSSNELYWSYLFYLSKIWEFIDTWIILWKGRKPSTLQTYHHMGAVFACWLQVIVRGKSFWVFVCLNSFIHTIMYAYYCCTTLGYRFKFKFIITVLQLTQFVVGQALGYYQVYSFGECYATNDFWVWFLNTIYVWPLVALFAKFYVRTYLNKKEKKV